MDNYGTTMKGPFIVQQVATKPVWYATDQGRIIYVIDEDKYYNGTATEWLEGGGGGIGGTDPIDISTSAVDGSDNNSVVNVKNATGQNLTISWHSSQSAPEQTPNTHGRFSSGKVYNAIYNDIVDFFPLGFHLDNIEMGKVYILNKDGSVKLSETYGQKGILGITSDTYGFGVGSKSGLLEQNGVFCGNELPISIGGFVLANIDPLVINDLEPGDLLTCGHNGCLTKLLSEDNNSMVIAYYLKPEPSLIWNEIKVNGRYWVKIK